MIRSEVKVHGSSSKNDAKVTGASSSEVRFLWQLL